MPQARYACRPLPFGDRVTVGVKAGVVFAGRQREADLIHTVRQGAMRPQPGVGEHLQHGRVVTERLRLKGADSPAARQRDQMLQQQRADTATVHVIGNRHGDLRRPGAAAHQLVAAAADHLTRQHRQQRGAARPGLAAYPARFLLGRDPARAEKAPVQILRGHLGVHLPHRIEIIRARGTGSQSWSHRSAGRRHAPRHVHSRRSPVLPPCHTPRPHYRIGSQSPGLGGAGFPRNWGPRDGCRDRRLPAHGSRSLFAE